MPPIHKTHFVHEFFCSFTPVMGIFDEILVTASEDHEDVSVCIRYQKFDPRVFSMSSLSLEVLSTRNYVTVGITIRCSGRARGEQMARHFHFHSKLMTHPALFKMHTLHAENIPGAIATAKTKHVNGPGP
jgi:hypothetical protein